MLDIYADYFRRKMSILFYCLSTGEEAFICLLPHEAIVYIYLHVCAMCMQNNLMKITTTVCAFASIAAIQNLLCKFFHDGEVPVSIKVPNHPGADEVQG